MNHADIAAARRLIAEFEDKADGRHNSNQWNRPSLEASPLHNPQRMIAVIYRREVRIKESWKDCAVGDYCKPEEWEECEHPFLKMIAPAPFIPNFFDYNLTPDTWELNDIWEFERKSIERDGTRSFTWKRTQ